ncbi:MAG: DUF748 domain-containing protein, partial [Proteobacteria bacterium]|nr:DUF748 domain-containing protein [Pseudomonadota bacterium]
MDSKKPLYKSIPFWAVALFLFYSALGFLAVPYFIKKQITLISSNELNSKIDFDSISFNPYSFTTQLDNLKLADTDSTVWFSADKLLINLGLFKSVFSRTSISEITLDNPHFHLLLEHKNNATQLKYPKIKPADSQDSETFDIDIGNININNGSLSYLDTSSHNIVELKFKEIGFKHIGFSTDDKHSTFDLSLLTDQGDKAEFVGTFNFAQFSSSGKWSLSHFSTDTVFKIIADSQQQFYGFKNQSGSLSAKGEFSFNSNNEENIHLEISTLTLENFSATSSEPNQPVVKISELQLNQGQIDWHKKQLTIADIDLQNTEISASFSENNQ